MRLQGVYNLRYWSGNLLWQVIDFVFVLGGFYTCSSSVFVPMVFLWLDHDFHLTFISIEWFAMIFKPCVCSVDCTFASHFTQLFFSCFAQNVLFLSLKVKLFQPTIRSCPSHLYCNRPWDIHSKVPKSRIIRIHF